MGDDEYVSMIIGLSDVQVTGDDEDDGDDGGGGVSSVKIRPRSASLDCRVVWLCCWICL